MATFWTMSSRVLHKDMARIYTNVNNLWLDDSCSALNWMSLVTRKKWRTTYQKIELENLRIWSSKYDLQEQCLLFHWTSAAAALSLMLYCCIISWNSLFFLSMISMQLSSFGRTYWRLMLSSKTPAVSFWAGASLTSQPSKSKLLVLSSNPYIDWWVASSTFLLFSGTTVSCSSATLTTHSCMCFTNALRVNSWEQLWQRCFPGILRVWVLF